MIRVAIIRHAPTSWNREKRLQGHTDIGLGPEGRIVAASVKLPAGILKEAVASGRLVYDIQPAWEGERAVIWDMFKVAVDIGYLPRLPDEGAIYKPR